jgi:hypothetical protein
VEEEREIYRIDTYRIDPNDHLDLPSMLANQIEYLQIQAAEAE